MKRSTQADSIAHYREAIVVAALNIARLRNGGYFIDSDGVVTRPSPIDVDSEISARTAQLEDWAFMLLATLSKTESERPQ